MSLMNARASVASDTVGRHLGLALAVISAAQLMIVLDSSIVNVALPTIHTDLRFSTASLEWLITAYSLTFGGLLLFGGRTGDVHGKRRVFMVGIAVFAVSSLLCGFAQSQLWLILSRACQGIGGALTAPTALALIATNFPEGRPRNGAIGVYAAMSAVGGAVGLLLGGIFTDFVSWRWIFFVNVPIATLVLILAPRVLNESETTMTDHDLPGAITVTGGMFALVYGLSHAASHGWRAPGTIVPLVAAALLLVSSVLIESRSREPLMPLAIFANRNRAGTYGIMFCVGAVLFAMFYFLTQFLQNILGWMSAAVLAASVVASRLVGRIGIRVPLLVGPAAATLALLWMSRLTVSSGYADVLGPLLVLALGMGLTFVPSTLTAVSGVPSDEAGLASALLNTAQQIGGSLGVAVLATVAIGATKSKLSSTAAASQGNLARSAWARLSPRLPSSYPFWSFECLDADDRRRLAPRGGGPPLSLQAGSSSHADVLPSGHENALRKPPCPVGLVVVG
jgi:EmrB/QacA subfamily drug resistance transporter